MGSDLTLSRLLLRLSSAVSGRRMLDTNEHGDTLMPPRITNDGLVSLFPFSRQRLRNFISYLNKQRHTLELVYS